MYGFGVGAFLRPWVASPSFVGGIDLESICTGMVHSSKAAQTTIVLRVSHKLTPPPIRANSNINIYVQVRCLRDAEGSPLLVAA